MIPALDHLNWMASRPPAGIFMCERWRPIDLDVSTAIADSIRSMALARGHALEVWIGTEKDTTAAGMSRGVQDASLFIIVLRDGTLQGRGVQHEVATALRANKQALVVVDQSHDVPPLDELLAQASAPVGPAVEGYEALVADEVQLLRQWATTAASIGFRRDGSFEADSLPRLTSTVMAMLMSYGLHSPSGSGATKYPFRMLGPRPPQHGCDALVVTGGGDALLTALNLRRASAAAVSRRALVLLDLSPTADAERATALVARSGCIVGYLSASFWANPGAMAALRAGRATGRKIFLFHEKGDFSAAVANRPIEFAALVAEVISQEIERIETGGQRSGQLIALVKGLGAVPSEDAADALAPPTLPRHVFEEVLVAPRDAVIAALLPPVESTAADFPTAAVVISGARGTGKSIIAAAALNDARVSASFDDVVWLSIGGGPVPDMASVLTNLLVMTLAALRVRHIVLGVAMAESLREICNCRRVLLVLDGIDATHAEVFFGAVKHSVDSCVFFVTRDRITFESAMRPCVYVNVCELSSPAALQLLYRNASRPVLDTVSLADPTPSRPALTPAWEHASARLLSVFGHLPYALVLAGTCIRAQASIDEVSLDDAESATMVLSTVIARAAHAPGTWLDNKAFNAALLACNPDAAASTPIYRAIQLWLSDCLSRDELPKFRKLGLFPCYKPIPEKWIGAAWSLDCDGTHALLIKLQSAGLISWERQLKRVSTRDLAHDFAVALWGLVPGGLIAGKASMAALFECLGALPSLDSLDSDSESEPF